YTFIGWAVKAEAEAVTYSAVDVVINPLTGENDPVYKVTENITYVAVYEPSLRIFNVYFVDDNGSDLGKGFAYKVTWGETIKAEELAEATAAGNGAADIRSRDDCQFFFAGWTDVDKTPVGPADTVIKADTTFYASYSRQYKFSFYYHGSDASTYGKTDEVLFAQDSVKEGESYDVIKNGPTLASTPTTKYDFIGWSLEQIDPEVLPDYLEKKAREEAMVNTATVRFFAGAVTEDVYVNGCIVTLCADTILTLGENEDGTTRPIDLYPVFAASPVYYTVIFQDANGKELAKRTDFIYNEPALDLKPADPKGSTVVSGYTTTTTTFKGWDVSDEELAAVKRDMIVTAKYDVSSRTENPLPPITGTPTPTPSTTPTPTPTATPTPSATPTPTPEEEVIETPDTPQGPVDEPEEEEDIVVPTPETPQGAPEEEVDLDEPETPQGDLPKTGTTPTGVFFGIGAACIMLGSVVLKLRRREDEM
ncbi:MAG: LPXTG cell wall anchor domain-containing protein, partial [Clostridiales bacterium]|nr:LPXTG cell wall anchor domain-containing protein [Clostridiales bacterium]